MSALALRAQSAAFAYDDAVPLFSDVTFHLEPGWTGLVGPNGAGKTTLLRLLTRELQATEGALVLEPRDALVRSCPQRVEALEDDVRAFSEDWDRQAIRIRATLKLLPESLARWETLSPGERKRWQVGAALAASPDVLLLDEPTNHLDAEGREWLCAALKRFGGIGVVVSHDRTLLDGLTTRTLRVDKGSVRLYAGGFTQARAQWEQARATKLNEFVAAKEERARAVQKLHQVREAHRGAEAQRSAGRRMKGPKDSDARSVMMDLKVATAERRLGRRVAVLRHEAERAAERVGTFEFDKELGRSVFVGYVPCPRPVVLHLQAEEVLAGSNRVLGPTSLTLRRDERVHLAGPNGAGKTTLIRALLEASRLPPEQLLYLPQELSIQDGVRLLEQVRTLPTDVRGRVLSLVAALGVDPDRLLKSGQPSPGEARKLAIADGLGRHVWAIVLDEPTNHLDLPSIERLEAALVGWPGALLLVSHDAALAARVCRTRWSLESGELRVRTIDETS